MNPLLLLQLKKILVSLTILLNLITAQTSHSHLLGAATVTNGDNYPTSTYSFSDNDIINSGDLNLITSYTGIRTATDTVSLQGQIYNVSTTANAVSVTTATGTLPVAKGGTSTSTLPANGQLLIGNGTNYTLATLTAGANTTITNSTGSITIVGKTTTAQNLLAATTTSVTSRSTTATTTLLSVSIPANTMGVQDGIRATMYLDNVFIGAGGNTTISATINNVTSSINLAAYGIDNTHCVTNSCSGVLTATLLAANSTSTANLSVNLLLSQPTGNGATITASSSVLVQFFNSVAVTSTAAQVFSIQDTNSTANSNLGMIAEQSYVEKLQF